MTSQLSCKIVSPKSTKRNRVRTQSILCEILFSLPSSHDNESVNKPTNITALKKAIDWSICMHAFWLLWIFIDIIVTKSKINEMKPMQYLLIAVLGFKAIARHFRCFLDLNAFNPNEYHSRVFRITLLRHRKLQYLLIKELC